MTGWTDLWACLTCIGAPWAKGDLGFLWSTLLLMLVPVALAGIIGGWLFYVHSSRRGAGRREAPEALAARDKESRQ